MERDALVRWLDEYLDIDGFADPSLNGLQVEGNAEVRKAAFAVDSSMTTFQQAADMGADILVVHHGLFWGKPLAIRGMHAKRVRFLLENGISLYAAHLPLDAHKEVGNNWGLASILKMTDLEDFGEAGGRSIGVKGRLAAPTPRRTLAGLLEEKLGEPIMMLEGGPETVGTFGIVSGGAAWEVTRAADEGLDAFLTGEPKHEVYYHAFERGVNAMFGGHYTTETVGVNLLASRIEDEFGLPVEFIHLPTGL